MDQLIKAFQLSFAPDEAQLKEGERMLQEFSKQPSFAILLLQLLESPADNSVKVAASIQLKHFIEHNWVDKIGEEDKKRLRDIIVDLILKSSNSVARQLRAILEIIANIDWPQNWSGLLPLLIQHLQQSAQTNNLVICLEVLRMISLLFKRFNGESKSDEVLFQLRDILAIFPVPMLQIFKALCSVINPAAAAAPSVEVVLCMKEMSKIFYSLNCVDLPEFFEDNMKDFMEGFHMILATPVSELRKKWPRPIFAAETSEKPGPFYQLQQKILKCIALYATCYEEEFTPYLPQFLQDGWKLTLDLSLDTRYDSLAIAGIDFLRGVSSGVFHTQFADKQVLSNMCERIIVPNIMMREDDEELFEDNPRDYIRRDMEGSNALTRRRAISEFILALRQHYEQPVTELLVAHAQQLLAKYNADRSGQWAAKDAAIFLITSVSVKVVTTLTGVTSINTSVPVAQFFTTQIAPELQANSGCHPIVKADCLKFMTLFRQFIASSVENAHSYLQMMITALSENNFVIRTYAAIGIERLLAIKLDNGRPRFDASLIGDAALPLVNCLFNCLAFTDEDIAFENEYVMRAILRVSATLKERVAPIAAEIIGKIVPILNKVSENPRNPMFNYYVFEIIACVSKYTVSANAAALPAIEGFVIPALQNILVKDVVDFFSYAFQIFASFIDLAPQGSLSAAYENLFPSLMAPALWERHDTVPAISKLVQAYIRKVGAKFSTSPQLMQVFGIFQNLLSNIETDSEAFNIVTALVQSLNATDLNQYMPTVLGLSFQRVTKVSRAKTHRGFIVFFCRLVLAHGIENVIRWANSVQPNVLSGIICVEFDRHINNICTPADKKLVLATFSYLCCTSDVLLTEPYLNAWGCLLKQCIILLGKQTPHIQTGDEGDAIITEGGSSYSQLGFTLKPDIDTPFCSKLGIPVNDLAALRLYLPQGLHAFSDKHRGIVSNPLASNLSDEQKNILTELFQKASVPQPYIL